VTATAVGAAAAHHQPGGVARAAHPEVIAGWSAGWMGLELDGRDAGVEAVHGTTLALAVPVPVSPEVRLGVGLALYLPDQYLARIRLAPITEPRFVLLDNDARIVVEPVAALAYADKLGVGVGASLLADARSNRIAFDVGVVAGAKVGAADLDVELPPRVAPLIGLWLKPHPRVRAGVTYRGQLSLDLALDILANVEVAGVVTGDALVALRASDYFTPARLTGAVAIDVTADATLAAEVAWVRWSAFPPPPALDVLVALDITPPLVSTEAPAPGFTDVVTARLGGELWRRGAAVDVAARAGVAYLPSPVPPQLGLTSYADGDRLQLAAGVGRRAARPAAVPDPADRLRSGADLAAPGGSPDREARRSAARPGVLVGRRRRPRHPVLDGAVLMRAAWLAVIAAGCGFAPRGAVLGHPRRRRHRAVARPRARAGVPRQPVPRPRRHGGRRLLLRSQRDRGAVRDR
jgi:hypothetical protein